MAKYALIALDKAVLTHSHLVDAGSGDPLQLTGRRLVRVRDNAHWRPPYYPYRGTRRAYYQRMRPKIYVHRYYMTGNFQRTLWNDWRNVLVQVICDGRAVRKCATCCADHANSA